MNKRPILIVTVSYIIGILWGLYLEISIVPFAIIGCIINFTVCKYVTCNCMSKKVLKSKYSFNKFVVPILKLISLMLIIISISSIIVQLKEKKFNRFYKNMPIDNVVYLGVIDGEEKESEYYYNYVVIVKNVIKKENEEVQLTNKRILLKVKKSKALDFQKLEYGDKVVVEGNLEKASTRRNYKGYDYSSYLKTKGIYGICKSNVNTVKVVEKNQQFVINMWINKLKNAIKCRLLELLPSESQEIALALFLGESDLINENQKQVFSNANLSHVLAISGMHVAYVILGCNIILKSFDNRKGKYILIVILIFFAQLAGGSPSVIRAVIMCSIMITSKLVHRKSDSINNIAIACLIILIYNPYNILNLGFQLSFLGTLGIVLFYNKINNKFGNTSDNKPQASSNLINKILKKLRTILITSISANILIFPILIYVFNTFSLTFLISNILISPILEIIFFIGYITIIISLISVKIAVPLAALLNFLISIFNKIALISSNIKFLRCTVTTPSIITIMLYYVLILYVYVFGSQKINKGKYRRIVAIISIIIIVSHIIPNYNSGLTLHFIDVGQGDSTLIITEKNKKILIDGGGSETGNYDVGEKILVPYLLDRKIKTIDYMVISHFDSDHCKGLFSVIQKLNVKNVIICEQGKLSENYKCFQKIVSQKQINVICVKAGNRIKVDKSTFIDILWPDDKLIKENVLNNNSIVFKLNYRNSSILFTGDVEKIAEESIINKYGEQVLSSTILKVAHHGSKTSSTEEFVKMVSPRIALIGVGENNNFGHPNLDVIRRLEEMGASIYRTDELGEIIVIIRKNGELISKLISGTPNKCADCQNLSNNGREQ